MEIVAFYTISSSYIAKIINEREASGTGFLFWNVALFNDLYDTGRWQSIKIQ
jgi:hypothetical protein